MNVNLFLTFRLFDVLTNNHYFDSSQEFLESQIFTEAGGP